MDSMDMDPRTKYKHVIHGTDPDDYTTISVDVYSVIAAFGVVCPARQHAIKKILCAGGRGKGDTEMDLRETMVSMERAITIEKFRLYDEAQAAKQQAKAAPDPLIKPKFGSGDMKAFIEERDKRITTAMNEADKAAQAERDERLIAEAIEAERAILRPKQRVTFDHMDPGSGARTAFEMDAHLPKPIPPNIIKEAADMVSEAVKEEAEVEAGDGVAWGQVTGGIRVGGAPAAMTVEEDPTPTPMKGIFIP